MKKYKNLIFDIDGTLVDPSEGVLCELVATLEEFGISDIERESLSWCIGPPIRPSIKRLLGPSREDEVESVLARYRERFAEMGVIRVQLYPEVDAVLSEFHESGYTLFVATSRSDYLTARVLQSTGITHYFRAIYAPTPDGTLEEKALLIGHLLRSEQLVADESVMIGDRKYDIEGAKANAIDSIGILHGFGSREELNAVAPTALVKDLKELRVLLTR